MGHLNPPVPTSYASGTRSIMLTPSDMLVEYNSYKFDMRYSFNRELSMRISKFESSGAIILGPVKMIQQVIFGFRENTEYKGEAIPLP